MASEGTNNQIRREFATFTSQYERVFLVCSKATQKFSCFPLWESLRTSTTQQLKRNGEQTIRCEISSFRAEPLFPIIPISLSIIFLKRSLKKGQELFRRGPEILILPIISLFGKRIGSQRTPLTAAFQGGCKLPSHKAPLLGDRLLPATRVFPFQGPFGSLFKDPFKQENFLLGTLLKRRLKGRFPYFPNASPKNVP